MIGPRRDRRGYALIELLALITVITVMLGLCVGLIHLLLRLDRVGRTAADEAADMARLARDFRADAHASPADPPSPRPGAGITLSIAEGQDATYEVRPRDVLRTVREGDKVRRRETYRRPPRASVRFETTAEGPSTIVSLIVGRGPIGDSPAVGEVRIDAALGLDRRKAGRPE